MNPLLRLTAACIALASTFPAAMGADAEKPQSITEVHTWGELLAQKPVTLRAPATKTPENKSLPATYRLGIDSTHSDLYGGVLLYCLVEGTFEPSQKQDFLGPFSVLVEKPDAPLSAEPARAMQPVDATQAPMHLLMMVIPLNYAGEYKITLREPLDDKATAFRTVATTKVQVSKKHASLWFAWDEPETDLKDAESEDKKGDAGKYYPNDVANPAGYIALPDWQDGQSIPVKTPPAPTLPLPPLIPAKPDAGIHLSIKGNYLIVKFDKAITNISAPKEHFLTRWWVNGKPFTPELMVHEAVASTGPGAMWASAPVNEVRFRIEFHPKLLGAKKGDTIGVQLLHCPKGITYTGPDASGPEDDSFADDTDPTISRLTPRFDFTYTGDPAAISKPVAPH